MEVNQVEDGGTHFLYQPWIYKWGLFNKLKLHTKPKMVKTRERPSRIETRRSHNMIGQSNNFNSCQFCLKTAFYSFIRLFDLGSDRVDFRIRCGSTYWNIYQISRIVAKTCRLWRC